MTAHRVLVTGAGGAAGVAVLRASRTARRDSPPRSTRTRSRPGCSSRRITPWSAPASEPDEFVAGLADTVKRLEIDVVVCTVAEEMVVLADRVAELQRASVWLPTRESIEMSIDKLRFFDAMSQAGVRVPPTAIGTTPRLATAIPGPWVVKPRQGRGSRDVHVIDDEQDLSWACRRVPDAIVQTRVSGREFTVDLLTDRAGEVVGAVPRWRLETKAGISTKGTTFDDDAVVELTRRAVRALGLCGAANLQGFVTDAGEIVVIEINPRFSGGLSLSIAAGADLVGEYLRIAEGHAPRPERLRFRSGTTMTRYLQEVILP